MKTFCFTVDDNIRFFEEIAKRGYESIFDHPYLLMLRRLHERFDLKVQLNLFYRSGDFSLADVSARYAAEWAACADWLKLSFHSREENLNPYENAGYGEVLADCRAVNGEILRFASPQTLAKTTTVHYCRTTPEGLLALRDCGIVGLLGLFGDGENPRTSYSINAPTAARIRDGETVVLEGIAMAPIDMVINRVALSDIAFTLSPLFSREQLHVMIHEQYFYEDYKAYQPDFEEKLLLVFSLLQENGYQSRFFEDML